MATLNRIISLLGEQRRELLNQLDAVDRAIAALTSGGATAATPPAGPDAPADVPAEGPADVPDQDADETVLPRRVTSRRVLSDAHKQALTVGRRKAREARDAAKGLAREMPADSFVPAIGTRGDRQAPRLVKRRGNK